MAETWYVQGGQPAPGCVTAVNDAGAEIVLTAADMIEWGYRWIRDNYSNGEDAE